MKPGHPSVLKTPLSEGLPSFFSFFFILFFWSALSGENCQSLFNAGADLHFEKMGLYKSYLYFCEEAGLKVNVKAEGIKVFFISTKMTFQQTLIHATDGRQS